MVVVTNINNHNNNDSNNKNDNKNNNHNDNNDKRILVASYLANLDEVLASERAG